MPKPRNLDIFALLEAMDRRDGDWLSSQPAAARGEFAPIVALRWAAGLRNGLTGGYVLWLLNQRVNHRLFDLYQDPDLSFRLMASCGQSQPLSRVWLAASQPRNSHAADQLLAEQHPDANAEELRLLLSLYSRAEFAQLVMDCGLAGDAAKACLKAYDHASGT